MKAVDDPDVAWVVDRWSTSPAAVPPDGVGFGVLSIPFDQAVSYRPGTRLGPEAVRACYDEFALYCTDKRVDLGAAAFVDLGEVDVVRSLPESYERIRAAARAVPPDLHPVFLGGDHSISDPLFRAARDRAGADIGLVVFDAHFDARDPLPGREHSGHWVKTLEDVLDHTATAQLGISSNLYSAAYMRRAEQAGVMVRTPYDLRRTGWQAVLADLVEHVAHAPGGVYVSVDIDCVDQAHAPGTSVVNPAGLLPHEVMDAVFEIAARLPVVGFDITEVSPPLDPSGNTARVAANILHNFVAGTVTRHGRAPAGAWQREEAPAR